MRASREYARRGFTLVEMLGVVAILVIAFAVAVPNALNFRTDLRMMQLDEQAHQIYNAAQNRLTALQATGQLAALERELDSSHELSGTSAHIVPVDYPAENLDAGYWDTHELCYLHSSDAPCERYLVTDAGTPLTHDLVNGSFVVEFSPLTAEVYSVFYWENDASVGATSGEAIGYGDLIAACPVDRSRLTRTQHRLGYYGGGELGSRSLDTSSEDVPHAFDIQVVNSEELYVRITGGGKSTESLGMSDYDPQRLKGISLTVGDVENFLTVEGDSLLVDPVKGIDVRFILDSMRTDHDMSFKTLAAAHPNLVPGMDITIKAQALYNSESGPQTYTLTNLQGMESFTVNSLFESNENGVVKVSCVRHLNNLRQNALKPGQSLGNYTRVEVTRDIDFDGANWSVDGDPAKEQTVSATSQLAGSGEKNLNPLAMFTPIDGNEANAFRPIEANKDTEAVFDGKGFTLKSFRIGEGSDTLEDGDATNGYDNVGLFSRAFFAMRDLTMHNVRVVGGTNVGAFAGAAGYNSSFTNCNITGTSSVRGRLGVGGLVGTVEANAAKLAVESCAVSADVSSTDGATGGIVGRADKLASVKSCTVEGSVTCSSEAEDTAVGGIVGQTAADGARTAFSKCTVGSSVASNGGGVGGVVGIAGRCGAITSCKVQGGVHGAENIGGIAGLTLEEAAGIELARCTVTGDISGSADHIGGLVGSAYGLGNPKKHADASYADVHDCVVSGNVTNPGATARSRESYVAGLVGETQKSAQNPVFANCAVDSRRISGRGAYVGGLIGYARSCGAIRSCSVDSDLVAGEGYWRSGKPATSALGGIVGRSNCNGISIDRCTVGTKYKAHLDATSSHVGGIVGLTEYDATIRDCEVRVDIDAGRNGSGYSCAGGIVGYAQADGSTSRTGVRLDDCVVDRGSNIASTGMYTGGLAGYFEGSATDCRTSADIDAGSGKNARYSFAGGAFGAIHNSSIQAIKACHVGTGTAAVNVFARGSYVGGFAGTAQRAHISRSRVYGATRYDGSWHRNHVDGGSYTGGFLGMTGYLNPETNRTGDSARNGVQIVASFSAIDVRAHSGSARVGGFVGFGSGQSVVCYCYASGAVRGTSEVGGFAGRWENDSSRAQLNTCYTTSDVTGRSKVGGFVGAFTRSSSNNSKRLANCVSYGLVQASSSSASSLGPFAGDLSGAGSARKAGNYYGSGCAFLERSSSAYNTFEASVAQPEGLDDGSIATVFNTQGVSARNSHPYSRALQGQRFPYGAVVYEGSTLPHYGDWPQQEETLK